MNETYKNDLGNEESINTDTQGFGENFDELRTESALTYKCPNCDAGLVYDAEKQRFVCKFCISDFSEEELLNTDAEKKAKEVEREQDDFANAVNQYNLINPPPPISATTVITPWFYQTRSRAHTSPQRSSPSSLIRRRQSASSLIIRRRNGSARRTISPRLIRKKYRAFTIPSG